MNTKKYNCLIAFANHYKITQQIDGDKEYARKIDKDTAKRIMEGPDAPPKVLLFVTENDPEKEHWLMKYQPDVYPVHQSCGDSILSYMDTSFPLKVSNGKIMLPPPGVKDLAHFDPYKTVFFFTGKYHLIKNNELVEVHDNEAEDLLKSKQYLIWNIGGANQEPDPLPETCPAAVSINLIPKNSIAELLTIAFNINYKISILKSLPKN
jgi:hypothetical protein